MCKVQRESKATSRDWGTEDCQVSERKKGTKAAFFIHQKSLPLTVMQMLTLQAHGPWKQQLTQPASSPEPGKSSFSLTVPSLSTKF